MTVAPDGRRAGGRGSAPGRGHGVRRAPSLTRSRLDAARLDRSAVSSLRKARP